MTSPSLGTVKVEADTKVSVSDRLVNFSVIRIVESNFPTLEKAQQQEVVATVGSGIPQEERVIALDRVLSSLDKSEIIPKNVEGVKADPPTVFFSKTAAVLVNLDGDPIWSPIARHRRGSIRRSSIATRTPGAKARREHATTAVSAAAHRHAREAIAPAAVSAAAADAEIVRKNTGIDAASTRT